MVRVLRGWFDILFLGASPRNDERRPKKLLLKVTLLSRLSMLASTEGVCYTPGITSEAEDMTDAKTDTGCRGRGKVKN